SLLLHLRGRGERATALPRAVRRSLREVRLGLSALGHRLAGHVAGDRGARGSDGRHAGADPGGQRAGILWAGLAYTPVAGARAAGPPAIGTADLRPVVGARAAGRPAARGS